jgi:hypothetical protein
MSANANVIGPIYTGTSLSAWHTQAINIRVEGVMGTLLALYLSTQLTRDAPAPDPLSTMTSPARAHSMDEEMDERGV